MTTPLMRQYHSIKSRYRDSILFFRVGDFYETFEEDAKIVSRELKIVLTARDGVPLAGIPHHALYAYVGKLLDKGYKVAICEQLEDPKKAKGLVKRGVVRVLTPGTVYEEELVREKITNYLCSVSKKGEIYALASADISTGEFFVEEFVGTDSLQRLEGELIRLSPAEVICGDEEIKRIVGKVVNAYVHLHSYGAEECIEAVKSHFGVEFLEGLGLKEDSPSSYAVGAILKYVGEVHPKSLGMLKELRSVRDTNYMVLDSTTLRNLEIFRSFRGDRKGTLLSVLDKCTTTLGSRTLQRFLRKPLLDTDEINRRLDCVEELSKDVFARKEISSILKRVVDVERITSRIICENANPKEIVALARTLENLEKLSEILSRFKSDILKGFSEELKSNRWKEIASFIRKAVEDEPGSVGEGKVIRIGFNEEFDKYREALSEGRRWIAEIEKKERIRTGIKSLKVGYNSVIGYYIEVTKPNLHKVPKDYIRKQTLKNSERYTTRELQEKEYMIKSAEERIGELERELYLQVLRSLSNYSDDFRRLGEILGEIDVFNTFAEIAVKNNYTRPIVDESMVIEMKDARHPVVEEIQGDFVPNDVYLDGHSHRFIILTGPNMAGKSTYMRQVALITVMAQMGCFVPASYARIGMVDRIYTRVGAMDDIVRGQSTFMMEMVELANILNTATPRSLILLDEIGRGTSTFDGLSIAWSVTEYIYNRIKARTIFATHYHHLSELENFFDGIKNYHIEVRETPDGLVFVRKIKRGAMNESYGIEVAKLAGLPNEVVERAKEILSRIEEENVLEVRKSSGKMKQMVLFSFQEHPVLEELKNINVMEMTPVEALNKLYELQRKLGK